ncbi:MAG: metal-dependent transcriptional regulator [Anaerolineales bacterium]
MVKESVEDYLGGIYRLRESPDVPLPLSQLQSYLGYSRVSVHEMVQKLARGGFVTYHPYRGVTLTEKGTTIAAALLRRHRLWERFLTDSLGVPWDEAHEVAERLEHVTPEKVTERLADFLGNPDSCPHGAPTHPGAAAQRGAPLTDYADGATCCIVRISPESPPVLHQLHALGIGPSSCLRVVERTTAGTLVEIDERLSELSTEVAGVIWALPCEGAERD